MALHERADARRSHHAGGGAARHAEAVEQPAEGSADDLGTLGRARVHGNGPPSPGNDLRLRRLPAEHVSGALSRAPGSPALARRVQVLAQAAGARCGIDAERGFDHGMFAPMVVIYPDADVPVVQFSMKQGYDPQAHIALGQALAPLRDEGVLIIGSGLSVHNMRLRGPAAQSSTKTFDTWLSQTLLDTPPEERERRLVHWADAPAARLAHPQEDHLLPLMVAVGAARDDRATRVYHEEEFMGGAVVSSFRFDAS